MARRLSRERKRLRAGTWTCAVLGASLLVSIITIHAMAAPPAIGFDALWVRDHPWHVRLILGGIVLSVSATVVVLYIRRRRKIALGLWAMAAGLSAWFFSHRLSILTEVLTKHWFDL